MAKNTHNVPKKQWNKWNKNEQAMFNRLWYNLSPCLSGLTENATQRAFNVLRFNVCWMAADTMRDWRGWWY